MVTAYIGLGSNLGKRRANLLRAWAGLGEIRGIKLMVLSSPYSSEPVGMESTNWFINAVGSLQTSLQPEELLTTMLAVEASLGRQRNMQGTPEDRSVDLDLLYWGDRVCHDPRLILPHPEIANRLFVLLPLMEIAPQKLHPVLQKTTTEMLQECLAIQPGKGSGTQVQKTSWSTETNGVSG
jgi:2-amino-4-hydroxy-6-hydroxymethyldihydropteridine diphosphokinase